MALTFPEHDNVVFRHSPLTSVLCQIRFPPILALLGLVFPRLDGTPRNPVHVSSAFRKLVTRTASRSVTLHALRHGHASLLLDRDEKIHDVAARLGHDPAILLRRYAHPGQTVRTAPPPSNRNSMRTGRRCAS